MKTIVIGGSGFMGEWFLREFPENISIGRTDPNFLPSVVVGRDIVQKKRKFPISNKHYNIDLNEGFNQLNNIEIDNVIWLIGNSNHHLLNTKPLGLALDYNTRLLGEALNYFSTRKINKFVCFSTVLLYGENTGKREIQESDRVYPNQNNYIYSKAIAENLCEHYINQHDMPILNIRMGNVYGASELQRPDMIPTLIKDCLTKDNPTVWSKEPIRDFVYVKDVVHQVMRAMNFNTSNTWNLVSGESHSVGEICDIIEGLSGKKITSLNKEVTGSKELRFKPKFPINTSLEYGIKETFNIIKSYYE